MANQDFIRQLRTGSDDLKRSVSIWEKFHIDLPLLILLMILSVVGMVILYSGSGQDIYYVKRQAMSFVVAYAVMIALAQVNMSVVRRWAPLMYIGGVILLIGVLVAGTGAKGAQRWLQVPGLPRFQPSEIMKLIVPIVVASYFNRRSLPPKFKHVFWAMVLILLPAALIIRQPDLGTAILIATSGIIVVFLAGLDWKYIIASIVLAVLSAPVFWMVILQDYQKQRIRTLLNPEEDIFGAGWNIFQSKTAIGSGGFDGKGYLQGTQSQLDFLPESHTDFIIAVLAEEQGLFGVLLLLFLYLMIVFRGFYIGLKAQETFGRLLAGSITITFFVYVFVNVGMVSGLLPVVGVPLPLVSHGGTAIVSLMAGFGILMSISTEGKRIGV